VLYEKRDTSMQFENRVCLAIWSLFFVASYHIPNSGSMRESSPRDKMAGSLLTKSLQKDNGRSSALPVGCAGAVLALVVVFPYMRRQSRIGSSEEHASKR
jgi:hypothetical protein